MAYKQLPIVQEEFATTKYANQIKDNFDAIVGGQILRESLTQLSNRLTSVSEQFGQYNEEIQLLITEFKLLRVDIDNAIDAIDLRFNDLNEEITRRIATLGDNLKELESSTGYNTNLHQYFKNVEQARNLVLAINKLHEDLGDPRNLTTKIKENTVSSINELDREIGDLESLTTEEKNTIIGSINELDREIGPLNTLTTKNKNTIVQSINELETELGDVENLTTANKNNAVNAINELDREVGNIESIVDVEITASNLSEIINKLKELLGTFNVINQTIKQDNFVNTINKLYEEIDRKIVGAKLLNGKNIEINPENKINVLGGVTKDYLPETKYYKNDFIWNRSVEEEKDVLYKVIQDFTSTTFEEDLNINFVEVKTGGDGNVNQSAVVNTYKEDTVFEPGDLILVTENLDDPQNPVNIDIINKSVPIGCTYIQFTDESGNFLEEESPSFLYPNTQWQLMFNTESVYLRTEGSLSESGRTNGIQGDAGRNATGMLGGTDFLVAGEPYGVFERSAYLMGLGEIGKANLGRTNFNLSRAYTTASEFRTINRLMRMYKRIA